MELTWDDIARIHGIFVFDEAKAIHELDFGDLAGAMGVEVVLNIGLGSCITIPVSDARSVVSVGWMVQRPMKRQLRLQYDNTSAADTDLRRTIARQRQRWPVPPSILNDV